VDAESEVIPVPGRPLINHEIHDVGNFRGCRSGRTGGSRNGRTYNLNGDLNVPAAATLEAGTVAAVACCLQKWSEA